MGIVQLKRAKSFQQRRAALWQRYNEALAGLPVRLPPRAPAGEVHACHLYAIRLDDDAPIERDDFVTRMAHAGVNCSVHFIPLHLHAYWRNTLGIAEKDFPQSQQAFEKVVTLPLFTSMTAEMQEKVIRVATELLS
jgi:dTDP-4-amino-4,6-dideoxygalactose transaminase